MTGQAMVTVIAPLAIHKVEAVRAAIGAQLGNPATEAFRAAVEAGGSTPFLHFASLHALAGEDGKRGHLILEFSADGEEDAALALLAGRAGTLLQPIFAEASDWRGGAISSYLSAHKVKFGFGLFDNVGLAHCGAPGQVVGEIRREEGLAAHLRGLLGQQPSNLPPLGRIAAIREALGKSPDWDWALTSPTAPIAAPKGPPQIGDYVRVLGGSAVTTFLWPLLLLVVPLAFWLALPTEWPFAWKPALCVALGLGAAAFAALRKPLLALPVLAALWWFWPEAWPFGWGTTLIYLLRFAGLVLLGLLIPLALFYLALRRAETSDWLSSRIPAADELAAITAHENPPGFAHNHMVSHAVMKPGLLRKLTIRLAFWAVARINSTNPKPGHLGDIGTIHFARWITVPGTRDLIFFSNYGGSWESYLEDFITKAHQGLTAVWSNTVGFPRASNLFQDGATDGERFKLFARQSMRHTPFWFSAYPTLTTANIRTNQLVRRGLAAAATEAEVVRWLALFGSAPRPSGKLDSTQIQSLVFGGMGFKPDGRLVLAELGEDVAANRRWLASAMPHVAFNDGRYASEDAVLTLALSPRGLARLGLDSGTLGSFPAAFLQGMHTEGRTRINGDIGPNGPEQWQWGQQGHDLALLVYGDMPAGRGKRPIDRLDAELEKWLKRCGGQVVHRIELTAVDKDPTKRIEPFGFVDGISQPALRGTYRGFRTDNPHHIVEPGEFLLGYPDNRGNIPPGPMMEAGFDPGLTLPVAGLAEGFGESTADSPRLAAVNGSFLVIRQLWQDVEAFSGYCRSEGERLAAAFPELPLAREPEAMSEYVGAKMIGRWPDGASLVRHPYVSPTRLRQSQGSTRPVIPDNEFLFGEEDPQGLRCPYGAHVRRTNPRESFAPSSEDQLEISNRHRILRVGRGFLGEKSGKTEGLLFMCFNADIERQFEFVQQTWMNSTSFHGLSGEIDPIAGIGTAGANGFTIPSRRGPVELAPMPQFVKMQGGGYFFVAGRQLLSYLAASAD